jgi:NADPH2:quinone reductase
MRAAWYERHGTAPEVLKVGEIVTPEPGPGEVRVRVHVSGVNPSDVKRRAGLRGDAVVSTIIPHSDGAGIIDAVGEGVSTSRVGERVWIFNAQWKRTFGTAAEYVSLPGAQAVRLPDQTSFAEGACLGIPAMTAHRCVFADGNVDGETVMVAGGAGAVGGYAVQMAALGGATVIATVSSEKKAEIARAAGAHHIINYETEDVSARVNDITGGRGLDRIVEVAFGTNLATDVTCLKENGVIAAYGSDASHEPRIPFYALLSKGITVHFVFVYLLPEAARESAIVNINSLLESGSLRHFISHSFPLTDIVEAHKAVESGNKIGRVLIHID